MKKLTETDIELLIDYGGYKKLNCPDGYYFANNNNIDGPFVGIELLSDCNFIDTLENKMIDDAGIVTWKYTFNIDRSGLSILYSKHHYHLAEIEVQGLGDSIPDAKINVLLNYLKGKNEMENK